MGWQFIPMIRQKLLIFHQVNGYIILVLVFTGNIGALMIASRAFGGTLETQAGIGTLVILTTVSVVMAYVNIKRLQIDQHRAVSILFLFNHCYLINLVDAPSNVLPRNHHHPSLDHDYLRSHHLHNEYLLSHSNMWFGRLPNSSIRSLSSNALPTMWIS